MHAHVGKVRITDQGKQTFIYMCEGTTSRPTDSLAT